MRTTDIDVTRGRLRPVRHLHATVTRKGAMILDMRGKGTWHALSPVAAAWWMYVTAGQPFDRAAQLVATRYDTDLEQVRADGAGLLRDLRDRGLLIPDRERGAR